MVYFPMYQYPSRDKSTFSVKCEGGIMKKSDINKLLFSIISGIVLVWSGCVDTGVENIPQTIDYKSQVKFVNQVPNETATITMDGSQVATVPSGGGSAYMEAPSGSRNVTATYSSGPNVSGRVYLDTERKITVTIQEDSTGARSFAKTDEGYVWQ